MENGCSHTMAGIGGGCNISHSHPPIFLMPVTSIDSRVQYWSFYNLLLYVFFLECSEQCNICYHSTYHDKNLLKSVTQSKRIVYSKSRCPQRSQTLFTGDIFAFSMLSILSVTVINSLFNYFLSQLQYNYRIKSSQNLLSTYSIEKYISWVKISG